MTREEIVQLATDAGLCRQAGRFVDWIDAGPSGYELELFANLVEERILTGQKARYYQIGYEAGVRDLQKQKAS